MSNQEKNLTLHEIEKFHISQSLQKIKPQQLHRTLGPWTLWGLGVGYVIGGIYFGWNLGLAAGGSLGMLVAFGVVTLLYVTFVFSYAEMACAIPKAGGVFDYAKLGCNTKYAYFAGIAQVVEFLFAPPALAMAVGSYLAPVIAPLIHVGPKPLAVAALGLVTLLNVRGVKQAATFELCVAIVSALGLLLFAWMAAPAFQWREYVKDGWPHGWFGVFQAMPFAIWFFLGIEGIANVAEECRNPAKDIPRGFGGALATLIALAAGVMILTVGVAGWQAAVYDTTSMTRAVDGVWNVASNAKPLDSPLTLVLNHVGTGNSANQIIFHLLGLFGLLASLNGLMLASGRAIMEMGRAKCLPVFLGAVHPKCHTPTNALWFSFIFGTVALLSLDTSKLITWSALGAVMLYIFSIPALFGLRRKQPNLPRPYRVPFYPAIPAISLSLAVLCLTAMLAGNWSERGALAALTGNGSIVAEFALFWCVVYFTAPRANLSENYTSHSER